MRLLRLVMIALPAILATSLSFGIATAQAEGGMMMMTAPEGASEATKGYVAAMNTMSMSMATEFTGNADRDFITGMIPHHQGAVDAARVVLAHGSDPEVIAFAKSVIAAQEKEIAFMNDWLARNPQ